MLAQVRHALRHSENLPWTPESKMGLFTHVFNLCQLPESPFPELFHAYAVRLLLSFAEEDVQPALVGPPTAVLAALVEWHGRYAQFVRVLDHVFRPAFEAARVKPEICLSKQASLGNFAAGVFFHTVMLGIQPAIATEFVSLLQRDRLGEAGATEARGLLRSVVGVLLWFPDLVLTEKKGAYDFSREEPPGLRLYQEVLQPAVLAATRDFFGQAISAWAALPLMQLLQHIRSTFAAEAERIDQILHPSSKELVIGEMERLLLSSAELLLNHPTGPFPALLRQNRSDEIRLLFQLLQKFPEPVTEMAKHFCDFVAEGGRALVSNEALVRMRLDLVLRLFDAHERHAELVALCFPGSAPFERALREGEKLALVTSRAQPALDLPHLIAWFCHGVLTRNREFRHVKSDDTDQLTTRAVQLLHNTSATTDLFEGHYQRFMARRLLLDYTTTDQERVVLAKLKAVFGHSLTHRMEGMLRDLDTGRATTAEFLTSLGQDERTAAHGHGVQLLTSGYWPSFSSVSFTVPTTLLEHQKRFEEFYRTKYPSRCLQWVHVLGHCAVNAHFPVGRRELVASLAQAVVLLMFNERDSYKVAEISEALQLPLGSELSRLLRSLINPGLLAASASADLPDEGVAPEEDDVQGPAVGASGLQQTSFSASSVMTLNTKFAPRHTKLRINDFQSFESKADQRAVAVAVDHERQGQIDACVVRLLKSRQQLTHTELSRLVAETVKRPILETELKARIESLIEKEYMRRVEDAPVPTYEYMA
eukprot:TRINITY_DN5064_c0_g1_i1.p1 TRINITY_DN5064_c0_g1~~TRINITY_DN5064_c0_g1_i1.p1  ORF type:complete len:839 (-),score=177.20 TRINITY_DN5064_c0_g1_i1:14-2302(-)